jgi:ribA/ribD-fused uncharacterized protein
MTIPLTFDQLRDRHNAGEAFKFVHFWGHQPPRDGSVSQTCFSQWYEAPFEVDSEHYRTAEHFMMAEKARLFKDEDVRRQILGSANPGAAKTLGRNVKGFVEAVWVQHRFDIVCRANVAKFSQHAALRDYLIRTGNRILVEASPTDRIWGIGLAASDPGANNPNLWKGLNLLGFALMVTRDTLKGEG